MAKTKVVVTGSNGLLGQKLIQVVGGTTDFEGVALARGVYRLADANGFS